MRGTNGVWFVLVGLLGVGFFYLTDAHTGPAAGWALDAPIDAANDSSVGTLVGLAASVVVILAGIWFMFRKSI